jgi:tRNA/rRNA methyltransferase/tRNA (cytidine32/uridine32-2'-O)-methyltransferase
MASSELDNIVVVLWEPQDDINIGNTVRACKNFGVTDIRLVRPRVADPARIAVSAPKADDVIASLARCADLEEALEGCVYAIATTARPRNQERVVTEPRGAAQKAVEIAGKGAGKVAYLFGREDSGLPNDALDRCQSVVTIPTRPDYSSLNLGQAVLLNMWEVFRVASDVAVEQPDIRVAHPSSEFPPANLEAMEHMFALIERVIERTEFFKTPTHDHIMRLIRSVLMRAGLDSREQSTWFGIFHELERTLETAQSDGGADDSNR